MGRPCFGCSASIQRFTHVYIPRWILFGEHNDWLEKHAKAKRRRFARGGLSRDPDVPRKATDAV